MAEATKLEMIEWDYGCHLQSEMQVGFCLTCGEACRPFHPRCPQELKDTACEYDGEHPSCGGPHELVLADTTPDTMGGYEIYKCVRIGCEYTEAL